MDKEETRNGRGTDKEQTRNGRGMDEEQTMIGRQRAKTMKGLRYQAKHDISHILRRPVSMSETRFSDKFSRDFHNSNVRR